MKTLLLATMLFLVATSCYAQNLTNNQLVKLYGILLDATSLPHNKIEPAVIERINTSLSFIDDRWTTLKKENVMYGNDEAFYNWYHPQTGTNDVRFDVTIKWTESGFIPILWYFTQQSEIFQHNLAEVRRVAKYVSRTTNELNGIDLLYRMGQIKFLFSTSPPKAEDTKTYGRPLTTYKIAIEQ